MILPTFKRFMLSLFVSSALLAASITLMGAADRPAPQIASSRSTALGAVSEGTDWDPISLWQSRSPLDIVALSFQIDRPFNGSVSASAASVAHLRGELYTPARNGHDVEVVRSGQMFLVVKDPGATAEAIRSVAEGFGGYVSQLTFQSNAKEKGAGINIRVPAARFDEARQACERFSLRVIEESSSTEEVTRE